MPWPRAAAGAGSPPFSVRRAAGGRRQGGVRRWWCWRQ
jgi:hypothetical protein